MARLSWCNRCKENSILTKIYNKKNGDRKRVEICLNKGCGYVREIPFAIDIINVTGNMEAIRLWETK